MRHERLARSQDPLIQEIGEQLIRGVISPSDLLAIPEYRQVVGRGLARVRETLADPAWRPTGPDGGPGPDSTATPGGA